MSSSTIFVALQCCQCSTMQVKQKKKSSNKWSCAVCNQKQSLRKVFAQGFVAKDLRKFVQNFNMSRKSIDDGEYQIAGTLDLPDEHAGDELQILANPTKKRTDWTSYLDHDHHHHIMKGEEHEQGHHSGEPEVVTELHKGMTFKKRRWEEKSTGGGSDWLFKRPMFPNAQERPMTDQPRTSFTATKPERNNDATLDNQETKKRKPTISKSVSKWNDYLTDDNDNIELQWKGGSNFKDDSGPCNNIVLEAMTNELRVEDDIYPDFM